MTPSLEYLLPSFIFTQNCCLDRSVYFLEPYFAKFHINDLRICVLGSFLYSVARYFQNKKIGKFL